jgi:hypothetical protein
MNTERKWFEDGKVAAWAYNSLAIGFPGQHFTDLDVALFGGESAEVWRDRAVAEKALRRLEDGFFPYD